jgi:hypothetical protein
VPQNFRGHFPRPLRAPHGSPRNQPQRAAGQDPVLCAASPNPSKRPHEPLEHVQNAHEDTQQDRAADRSPSTAASPQSHRDESHLRACDPQARADGKSLCPVAPSRARSEAKPSEGACPPKNGRAEARSRTKDSPGAASERPWAATASALPGTVTLGTRVPATPSRSGDSERRQNAVTSLAVVHE